MGSQAVVNLTQIATSAVALFLGILTWRKTRDPKFIVLVLVALVVYLRPVIEYVRHVGILTSLPLALLVGLYNAPPLLIALIFFLYLRERAHLK